MGKGIFHTVTTSKMYHPSIQVLGLQKGLAHIDNTFEHIL